MAARYSCRSHAHTSHAHDPEAAGPSSQTVSVDFCRLALIEGTEQRYEQRIVSDKESWHRDTLEMCVQRRGFASSARADSACSPTCRHGTTSTGLVTLSQQSNECSLSTPWPSPVTKPTTSAWEAKEKNGSNQENSLSGHRGHTKKKRQRAQQSLKPCELTNLNEETCDSRALDTFHKTTRSKHACASDDRQR